MEIGIRFFHETIHFTDLRSAMEWIEKPTEVLMDRVPVDKLPPHYFIMDATFMMFFALSLKPPN